jgi:alpha-N-arabinofuranosidase
VVAASDTSNPLNGKRSLRLVTSIAGAGISQKGFYLKKGDAWQGSLWLRGDAPGGIMVKLIADGKVIAQQITAAPGSEWKEFKLMLNPTATVDSAILQIVSLGKATVWVDQVSLMANSSRATGGFRSDLLKAVAALKPASIRFPGGDFVNGYHWKNGVGPQYKRLGKGGTDPLAMGIDEFIMLCRKVGAEPAICVPTGKRDGSEMQQYIQEAEEELEYCNGVATTKWGKMRTTNGHSQPYHIKYWEIDNEVYLQGMAPETYLTTIKAFAIALHKIDPSIKIIGSGGGGTHLTVDKGWSVKMLQGDLSQWDYMSLHQYENYSRGNAPVDSSKFRTGIDDFEKYYAAIRDSLAKSNRKDLKVYESEWNYMSVDWRTGLYAGGALNCFERNSDLVQMACPALFLRTTTAKGWDNAFINFSNHSWFPAPNYVIMKLYRDHFEPYRIEFTGDAGPLNVVATKSKDGNRVVIKVVNANKDGADASFNLSGSKYAKGVMHWAAEQLDTKNTLDNPGAVVIHKKALTIKGNMLSVNMPRYSVAVIEVSKK